jgi:hypothetical protein
LTGSEDIRGRKCKIERDFGIQEALLQENWLFDDLSFMGGIRYGRCGPLSLPCRGYKNCWMGAYNSQYVSMTTSFGKRIKGVISLVFMNTMKIKKAVCCHLFTTPVLV